MYNQRAMICRVYPKEEVFLMGGFIGDDCGYSFIPIESFEKVFNKVRKQKYRKKLNIPVISGVLEYVKKRFKINKNCSA